MYGPQSRRQRAQLDAFYASLFDERDRILKVVVRVLRAIGCEDAARRDRFTVDCFDDAEFVWPNLDERHFAHHSFKRKLDQVQAGFEHVGLDADLTFGSDDASRGHLRADVTSLFDRDFARTNVDEDALDDDEEHNQ